MKQEPKNKEPQERKRRALLLLGAFAEAVEHFEKSVFRYLNKKNDET